MAAADSARLPLTPLARYRAEIERLGWSHDPAQEDAARRFDELFQRLLATPVSRRSRFRSARPQPPVRGLYLWGDTGRGKTWLADLFYQCLPFPQKLRRHFHRFMADVHEELKANRLHADPLDRVAERLADRARVICFDELFVSDIADAMILGTLFERLFARGVTLVATSNLPPQALYRDGLQRARFLPAIALLELHTEAVQLGGNTDYRLRLLERAEIYHAPLDAAAEAGLQAYFAAAAPEDTRNHGALKVLGREIPVRCRADGVAWFDFAQLCGGPRSQADYIEIAKSFHTVLLSGVPQLTPEDDDVARRFIALVDEFYDRSVKLIVSAAVPLDELYRGRRLASEFRRATSRLEQMRSTAYLAAPHLP
jgi:cell division protein ZapE